ncbi:hypothetical protein CKO32_13375 [Afifella marina DSM 2698]|nr:hypothetical protein [Afifella marina DSM 2698]MBK1627444.1 hypothetical protein [Afifella marina]MBK5918502.1 hypothetical protein [Afifella marina]RAI20656.1 hypothetical protein CH311_09750 [Afifella marina DSM 2698]
MTKPHERPYADMVQLAACDEAPHAALTHERRLTLTETLGCALLPPSVSNANRGQTREIA